MGQTQPVVFVVDPNLGIRQGIAAVARPAGFRVECYASAEDFLAAMDPNRTGCLVLEVRLEGMSGFELLGRLREMGSLLPVIVLSGYVDVGQTVEAMRWGVRTVLEKPCAPGKLMEEIREAIAWDRRTRAVRQRRQALCRRVKALDPRERRVLALVLEDWPNRVIAHELGVSQRTVDRLRARIYSKLGVQSAVEAARLLGPFETERWPQECHEPQTASMPAPYAPVCRPMSPPHWPVSTV